MSPNVKAECEASVYKPWHSPFYLFLVLLGTVLIFSIFDFLASQLEDKNVFGLILISFSTFILGIFSIFFVVARIARVISRKRIIRLTGDAISFDDQRSLSLFDISSYDTNVETYTNRLYLTIRPKGRMSLRLISNDNARLAQFCRAFQQAISLQGGSDTGTVQGATRPGLGKRLLRMVYYDYAEKASQSGLPVKRSFYGSPLARLIGVLGLLTLGGGVIGALLVDPALAVYALLLAVAGGAPMLILALGGRAD